MFEQGSEEWMRLRLGKATASRIADIQRKGKSGPSLSRQRYLGELVAERLTGVAAASFKSADMEWGNATEADARNAYAFYHNAELHTVDFVDHPSIQMCGASPDRLVSDVGLLEIKCPATHTHIATLLGAPIDTDYMIQMQWQMACTGRLWCDFASYDPRLPEDMRLDVRRVARNDEMITDLTGHVVKFLNEVASTVESLEAKFRRQAA